MAFAMAAVGSPGRTAAAPRSLSLARWPPPPPHDKRPRSRGAPTLRAWGNAAPPPPPPPPPPPAKAQSHLQHLPAWLAPDRSDARPPSGRPQPYAPPESDEWTYEQFSEALRRRAVDKVFIMSPPELRLRLRRAHDHRSVGVQPRGVPLTVADVRRLAHRHGVAIVEGIPAARRWAYSDFLRAVDRDWVRSVRFEQDRGALAVSTIAGTIVAVEAPADPQLVAKLLRRKVRITAASGPGFVDTFISTAVDVLTYVLAMRVMFWVLERVMGNGPLGLLKGLSPQMPGSGKAATKTGVKFDDVAGVEDAKAELVELVDFLKSPEKYTTLGATIPKGVLLIGPPGTGKTLLAKAVAGEAGVPFLYCSAAGFVEVFAGVGASRVRALFAEAKKKAPCIIFVDELDAVGRSRDSGGSGGAHEEREQTINQLLTEMDGFVENSGVVVLAATNRADVLDRALLRPGRFDRQVHVDPPDVRGREAILRVHARGKPLGDDVDLGVVARRTPGFTGADLRNLLNEASIGAGRRRQAAVAAADVDAALERILVGPEKSVAVTTAARQRLVAYHEAGHALVGARMADYDPVAKVTIVPRGRAGGLTFFTPSADRLDFGLYTRQYLEQKLVVAFGGRAAEELVFGESQVTTGATSDLDEATRIATAMVTTHGFSAAVGLRAVNTARFPTANGLPPASEALSRQVDREVQRLLLEAADEARRILKEHKGALHRLAARLIEKETLDGEEVLAIIAGASGDPSTTSSQPPDGRASHRTAVAIESGAAMGFPDAAEWPLIRGGESTKAP